MSDAIKLEPIEDDSEKAKFKEAYLKYYADCPIQKYAAAWIGRSHDTIQRWKKEDASFASSIEAARALWVRKKLRRAKPEFALERLESELFGEKNLGQDPNYQKFQQFNFIFTLKPDELQRFIEAAIARGSEGASSNSSELSEDPGKGASNGEVGASTLSE